MPTWGRVCTLLASLALFTNTAISDPAKPSALPANGKQTAKPERISGRTCVDMNGKSFGWYWPNVPFAAVCTFEEREPAPQK
jgi:hypothetical protein